MKFISLQLIIPPIEKKKKKRKDSVKLVHCQSLENLNYFRTIKRILKTGERFRVQSPPDKSFFFPQIIFTQQIFIE